MKVEGSPLPSPGLVRVSTMSQSQVPKSAKGRRYRV